MSVCAVMLVKDEADVIEATVRHLLTQVDEVFVADNLSTDGTFEILTELSRLCLPVSVQRDEEVGYRQAEKTTRLAQHALYVGGHDWVVPCDADEVWYSPFGRIGDVLDTFPPDVVFVRAALHDHIPTGRDVPTLPPFARIGWRFIREGALRKVACRLTADLTIGMGNHDARTTAQVSSNGAPAIDGQLKIRHFSWRSEAQFLRKIRNGAAAYAAAPDLGESYGEHWRQFEHATDEAILGHFRTWFYVDDPFPRAELDYDDVDARLIYDPAPVQT